MPKIFDTMMNYLTDNVVLKANDMQSEIEEMQAPSENFIKANIEHFKKSEQYKFIITAQKYADIENEEITNRERFYIDFDGNKVMSEYLANNKIINAKFVRLVAQKIGYLISKPFTIKSDDKKVVEILEKQFAQRGLRKIKKWASESIINGIEYMQVYFDENGQIGWKRIPAYEIVPFWKDEDHMELEACIRFYKAERFKADGTREVYEKYEYHSTNGSWYFIQDDKGMRADPDYADPKDQKKALQQGHFKMHYEKRDEDTGEILRDENGDGIIDELDAVWHTLPIIPLAYQYEKSLLKFVKPKIDNYDKNTSDVANMLEETPNAVKVVKNFDGTDPAEFNKNLNVTRMAFVSSDGDLTNLETTINTDAVEAHLTRLDDDINMDGGGVNLKNDELGNASGAAIKYRYSGLENDMNDFSAELSLALQQLSWFILFGQVANGQLEEQALHKPIDFIFNTDMVTNETETVEMLEKSVGMISQKTIVANHPLVDNVDDEIAQLEEEQAKDREESDLLAQRYGFGVNQEPNEPQEPTDPQDPGNGKPKGGGLGDES